MATPKFSAIGYLKMKFIEKNKIYQRAPMLCLSNNADGLVTSPYGFLQIYFCQSISFWLIHLLHFF